MNIFSIKRKLPAICMYVEGLILEEILQSGQRSLQVAEKNSSWLTNKGKEQKKKCKITATKLLGH